MGSFLASIFGGQNKTLDSATNKAGDISNFSTTTGQGALTDADKFYKGILSGDPSQISETLAPEIKTGQEQTQQEKNQLAQFGTRSGGTAGASAGADAANRANIISLIGKLQQGAAGAETGIGENQTGLGLSANGQQAELSQQQLMNMINSILGKGVGQAAGAGITTGLSKIGL